MRAGDGPVLLRLRVPRLSGHSAQDTQAYKSAEEIAAERARDPLLALRQRLVPAEIVREPTGRRSRRRREAVVAVGARAHRRRGRRFRRRPSRATSSPSGAPTAAPNCRPRAGSGRTA